MTFGDSDAPISIIITDDQDLVRAGLALILGTEDGIVITAECADGGQAVEAVGRLRPDLVLMDVRMPGIDGLEATRQILALSAPPPVLILTTFDDDDVLWGAVEAGAAGFVLKDTPAPDMVRAVRTVAAGGAWLDPRVTPRLLHVLRTSAAPRASAARALDALSERELEVLRLMALGLNNTEAAERLYVSERTVKSHVGSIFSKLGVRDRAAAIVMAYESGLVTPGQG